VRQKDTCRQQIKAELKHNHGMRFIFTYLLENPFICSDFISKISIESTIEELKIITSLPFSIYILKVLKHNN